jgi:phosphoglycolate phosphatase
VRHTETTHASGPKPISLVCCGLVGTVVADGGMVDRAFAEAIGTQGVVTGTTAYARCMARVHQARGMSTVEILSDLFPDSVARGQAAHLAFDRSFCDAIGRMGATPMPGATEAIEKLAGAGIRICLITGLSRKVLTLLLDTLGWWDRVDQVLCPEDVPRGAPWPDLVLAAMLRLGVEDVRETAVVHDTANGILCGRRAGASIVAGALTGTHSEERLRKAGATHLISSAAYLPELVTTDEDLAPATASGGPAGSAKPVPDVPEPRQAESAEG